MWYLTVAFEPALIIHGTVDDTFPYKYGQAIQTRMEEIGNSDSRMITLEGRGHAQYKYVADNLMGEIVSFLNQNAKE